jgi:hypothetical protein
MMGFNQEENKKSYKKTIYFVKFLHENFLHITNKLEHGHHLLLYRRLDDDLFQPTNSATDFSHCREDFNSDFFF